MGRSGIGRFLPLKNINSVDKASFKPNCLAIDLEVSVEDAKIYELAAVRGDNGRAFAPGKNKTHEGLAGISHFSQGLNFLLGHNMREHDLPYLRAAKHELG